MVRKLGDIVREAVIKCEIPQYEVKQVLVAVQDAILKFMVEGDDVLFGDLGKFRVRIRPAHSTRNPRTGETWMQPATRQPFFKFHPKIRLSVRANRRGLDDKTE